MYVSKCVLVVLICQDKRPVPRQREGGVVPDQPEKIRGEHRMAVHPGGRPTGSGVRRGIACAVKRLPLATSIEVEGSEDRRSP